MSREWLAVYAGILNKPKYRRLSPAGRGALLHLWTLASTQSPEATWDSRDELLDAFELEGFEAGSVDELIALRWLDIEPDGSFAVHDWDEWQMGASRAIRNAWEAKRLKTWRRAKTDASKEKVAKEKTETVTVQRQRNRHVTFTNVSSTDDDDVSSEAYSKGPVKCAKCGDVILGASLRTGAGPMHQGGCAAAARVIP
jgi:hypothetical protein